MDKHVNFYFQSLLSTIIYVFDILFNLPESRKLRKILPGFSTSHFEVIYNFTQAMLELYAYSNSIFII